MILSALARTTDDALRVRSISSKTKGSLFDVSDSTWADVRPVKIHVTSSMRSGRTYGALLCNGRLKSKIYGTRSIARYTCLIKDLPSFARSEISTPQRHVIYMKRVRLLLKRKRAKPTSSNEWRNSLANSRGTRRGWRYTSGDLQHQAVPPIMLVQKADLESNNWRLRWQIFGMSYVMPFFV